MTIESVGYRLTGTELAVLAAALGAKSMLQIGLPSLDDSQARRALQKAAQDGLVGLEGKAVKIEKALHTVVSICCFWDFLLWRETSAGPRVLCARGKRAVAAARERETEERLLLTPYRSVSLGAARFLSDLANGSTRIACVFRRSPPLGWSVEKTPAGVSLLAGETEIFHEIPVAEAAERIAGIASAEMERHGQHRR